MFLEEYPYIHHHIQIIQQYRLAHVIARPAGFVMEINHSGLEVMKMCDGTIRCEEIIGSMIHNCADSIQNQMLDALGVLFQCLYDSNIIGFQKTPILHPRNIIGNCNAVYPTNFVIELTDFCNLACRHCYRDSHMKRRQFISMDALFPVLDCMQERGVRSIHLTGGEPTAHPYFPEILNKCLSFCSNVILLTNGTLLNRKVMQDLKRHKDQVIIQIDLDGDSEAIHDDLRGIKGAFTQVLQVIGVMAEEEIPFNIAMNVYSDNLARIKPTMELAKKLGAKSFACSPVMGIGRGRDIGILDTDEHIAFIHLMNELYAQEADFVTKPKSTIEEIKARINCSSGSKSLIIGPTGNIRACVLLNDEDGIMGNIFHQEYDELFQQDIFKFYYDLEAPKAKTCVGCQFATFCLGCFSRPIIYEEYFQSLQQGHICVWKDYYSQALQAITAGKA